MERLEEKGYMDVPGVDLSAFRDDIRSSAEDGESDTEDDDNENENDNEEVDLLVEEAGDELAG